jgi:hypothetical protein
MANGEFAEPADDSSSDTADSLSQAVDLDSLADSLQLDCNSVELIRWQLSKIEENKKDRVKIVIKHLCKYYFLERCAAVRHLSNIIKTTIK